MVAHAYEVSDGKKQPVPANFVGKSRPFPKGVSGNPGGRAKGYERRLRECVDGMMADDPLIKAAELKTMQAIDPSAGKIPAFEAIVKQAVLDAIAGEEKARAWIGNYLIGKPKESIDVTTNADAGQLALLEALRMTPHERRAYLAQVDAEDEAELAKSQDSTSDDVIGD